MSASRPRTERQPLRSGFTVLEMLVVIAIIILLLSLTSAAVLKFIGLQERNNTITGLKTIQTKVNTQWQTVSEKAFTDASTQADTYIAKWLQNNPGQLPPAARAAYVQAMLKQAFPVSFAEALTPDPLGVIPAWPAYQKFLNGLGFTTMGTTATQPLEPSVCLMLAVTKGPYNTGATADVFGSANVANQTVGSGQAQAFIDGFGTPLGVARNANGLVLTSAGPDRILGTADDIASNALPQ